MINDIKLISEDSKYQFESKLKETVRRFQEAGLKVEIQFSANTYNSTPFTEFSALVVGKENPVNKG